MSTRSRILIADDHVLIAELCQKLLEKEFSVVGIVGDGHALIEAAERLRPDVVVIDVAMPILNGLEAGRRVKKLLPSVKIVYLSMTSDTEVIAEAFRRGANGYLLKTCAAAEIVLAIRYALSGQRYMSSGLSRETISFLQRQDKELINEDERLTDRQREVLQLLAEGKVMKEVGGILNMSTRTVAYHKYRMMEVLGAKSTADLVKYAVRCNVIAA